MYNTMASKKQIQNTQQGQPLNTICFPLEHAASYWGLGIFSKDLCQQYSCGRGTINLNTHMHMHAYVRAHTYTCIARHIFQTAFAYII